MFRKILIILSLLSVITISLTACGNSTNDTFSPSGDISGTSGGILPTDASDTVSSEPEASEPKESETTSEATATNNSAAGTASKPSTSPSTESSPTNNAPVTTSKPTDLPATSSKPPSNTQTPTPSTPTPSTPSIPPTPDYEILGQDYINGVLAGVNERRAALGLSAAKFDSALSNECLVQAKKMAVAGYDFHSENPTGCEATAKMPYNFPAELLGDLMCDHVPNFLDADRTKVGIAVVKKGNSLFAVLQGTY